MSRVNINSSFSSTGVDLNNLSVTSKSNSNQLTYDNNLNISSNVNDYEKINPEEYNIKL